MPTAIAGCRNQPYDIVENMTMPGAQAREGSREILVSLTDGELPVSLRDGELPVSLRDRELPVSFTDGELPVSLGDGELPGNVSRRSPPKAEPVI
jgi:hypothetical protein